MNDYLAGVIRLYHTSEDLGDFGDITAISVYRKCTNPLAPDSEWTLVDTKKVITTNDQNFMFVDYSARSGESYEYKTIASGFENGIVVSYEGSKCSVASETAGIVIGAGDEYYTLNFNVTYTAQKEYNMAYVRPYYSKYPHAIQNGDANFHSGSVSSYFNQMGDNCTVNRGNGYYAEQIENFLMDGRIKTLKTYDGYVWKIMIDAPVKREKTNEKGLVFFTFNWHAVAEPSPAGFFA